MESVLEYMWTKVSSDGKFFIPQFDIDTGKQNKWYDDNIPMSKIILMPLTEELADKITKECNISAAAVPYLPQYTVNLNPDDEVHYYNEDAISFWDNGIEQTSHMECRDCGHTWKHTDSTKFYECPNCGLTDIWYCEHRHSNVPLSQEIIEEKARRDVIFASKINPLVEQMRSKEIEFDSYQRQVIALRTEYAQWAIKTGVFSIVDQKNVVREKDGKIYCPVCKFHASGLGRLPMIDQVADLIPFVNYVIQINDKVRISVGSKNVDIDIL
jgi:predicted RNA-binding Zn-ribbon protein involved in translation (DUF1610 family)